MDDVRFYLDIEAELGILATQLAPFAAAGAQFTRDAVRDLIPNTDIPAAPGRPPSSTGPLRDSWRATKAKRQRRGGDAVVAYAYSMVTTAKGESLNEVLDEGRGPIHPHPFLRLAEHRAEADLSALLSSAGG